jgi:methyltransferase-like protein
MLHFLAEHGAEGSYSGIFRSYADFLKDGLKGASDAFLLHDELEETNDPVYFHQFVRHAARHDLQYLSEVELREGMPSAFAPEVQAWLKAMATDTIALEQYMDFLRNRMFRQTLLCRADAPLQRTLRPEPLYGMTLRSQAKRMDDFVSPRPGGVQFKSKDHATLTTDHPLTVAALTHLAQLYPQALAFADLLTAARSVPGVSAAQAGGPPDELILAANLLRGHAQSSQLVSLHSFAPDLAYTVSAWPTANAAARWEAATRTLATNGWHERVTLQPSHQRLLPLLDGTRTRADLAAACAGELSDEEIALQLQWFAFAGLLVG